MDNRKLRIEYHLLDKCNLNCKACSHFCSLVKEEEPKTLEKIKQDFADVYRLTNNGDPNYIEKVTIMGGEPLMYHDLMNAVPYIKSLFPQTDVWFLTNGLLFHKMDDAFFDMLRDNNIITCVSLYPIANYDYAKMFDLLYSKNINWTTYTIVENDKRVFDSKWLKNEHNPNYAQIHHECRWRYNCTHLVDGKIYLCALIAYFNHFDNAFKGQHDIKLNELDYIDLSKINTWEELQIERDKVPHFCGYCRGLDLGLTEWDTTKRDINEWLNKT